MNDNANKMSPSEWLKNILKVLGLMAGVIWKFWLHPHYTTGNVIYLIGGVVLVTGVYLVVRRFAGSFLLLLLLGMLVVTTVAYAIHL